MAYQLAEVDETGEDVVEGAQLEVDVVADVGEEAGDVAELKRNARMKAARMTM